MVGGMLPSGCYTCPACRAKRRREWSSRLELEAASHTQNTFVTLTYENQYWPMEFNYKEKGIWHEAKDGSLNPKELQGFLKRLRTRIQPQKIKFYAAGEYGSETNRPHFHLLLFGYKPCLYGQTNFKLTSCCVQCETVKQAWGNGGVQLGEVNQKSIRYITKYVTKGLNNNASPMLRGRYKEFTRMSLREGIGKYAAISMAQAINSGKRPHIPMEDVPITYKCGGKIRPLGRYLRSVLRKETKISSDGKAPESTSKKFWEEMRELRKNGASLAQAKATKIKSFKEYIIDITKQKWSNAEAKSKILSTNKGNL